MNKYGLIGETLSYSFSKSFFTKKFEREGVSATYENFEFETAEKLREFLFLKAKKCEGLNVTIPYKETVIPHLYRLQKQAKEIGAVNTIKITKKGHLIGYNTDTYGFTKALLSLGDFNNQKALILGTGGASKAVAYSLKQLQIPYRFVSRKPTLKQLHYSDISAEIIQNHHIVINTTPLGTAPNVDEKPSLPYSHLTHKHTLFDLVYNPKITSFLKEGIKVGATTSNGYNMLVFQAEKAWEIWNTP